MPQALDSPWKRFDLAAQFHGLAHKLLIFLAHTFRPCSAFKASTSQGNLSTGSGMCLLGSAIGLPGNARSFVVSFPTAGSSRVTRVAISSVGIFLLLVKLIIMTHTSILLRRWYPAGSRLFAGSQSNHAARASLMLLYSQLVPSYLVPITTRPRPCAN